ncbi:MAG: hypothetical protein ACI8QC_001286 [Planctomycetota bacterium]|jgi:hypothetical protein
MTRHTIPPSANPVGSVAKPRLHAHASRSYRAPRTKTTDPLIEFYP